VFLPQMSSAASKLTTRIAPTTCAAVNLASAAAQMSIAEKAAKASATVGAMVHTVFLPQTSSAASKLTTKSVPTTCAAVNSASAAPHRSIADKAAKATAMAAVVFVPALGKLHTTPHTSHRLASATTKAISRKTGTWLQ